MRVVILFLLVVFALQQHIIPTITLDEKWRMDNDFRKIVMQLHILIYV